MRVSSYLARRGEPSVEGRPTVYWEIAAAPDVLGVAIGAMTDPTLPPPMISGFEAYGHPWAMTASDLPMPGGIMTSGGTSRMRDRGG